MLQPEQIAGAPPFCERANENMIRLLFRGSTYNTHAQLALLGVQLQTNRLAQPDWQICEPTYTLQQTAAAVLRYIRVG